MSAAATAAWPDHRRLLNAVPEGMQPLRVRLPPAGEPGTAQRGSTRQPVSARTIFKLGRDLAEALTALHLVGLSAGRVDPAAVYVDEGLTEAFLLPHAPPRSAASDPLDSTPYRDAQRADLIGLGRLLFELCCRRPLRPSDVGHLRRGFLLASLHDPEVPPGGDAVIERLLGAVPGRGYARAKQALDDLRAVVLAAGGTVPERPAAAPGEIRGKGAGPASPGPSQDLAGRRARGRLACAAGRPAACPVADAPPRDRACDALARRLERLALALAIVLGVLHLAVPPHRPPGEDARAPARGRVSSVVRSGAPR